MHLEQLPASLNSREKKQYYLEDTSLRRILTALLRSASHLFTILEVNAVENLPASGPVILASNHLTNYDVFFMQFALPRLIFFIGKAELFTNPLMDALLRRLGGFPVVRGARDDWAVQHALRVLQHGQVLGIFPEGKRNLGHGLRAAKTGAARFAISSGAPIVPMTVTGTDQMFKRLSPRTRIGITLGAPIYPQPDENPLELTDRMMFAMAELLPSKLRGVYAQHPPGF